MSMYLTIILFLFPLKFTFTLGAFFSAKKWTAFSAKTNLPNQDPGLAQVRYLAL